MTVLKGLILTSLAILVLVTILPSTLAQSSYTLGILEWSEDTFQLSDEATVQVIDPDMNFNSDRIDVFDVQVWANSDAESIIDLTVTETDEATGIFIGTISFTSTDESSGHRLRITEGDTITAQYEDKTLPSPYSTSDKFVITTESKIKHILSPLKQQTSGILPEDITCRSGLEKIFKYNGSVVCVKPLSAEKLIHRGYGTMISI